MIGIEKMARNSTKLLAAVAVVLGASAVTAGAATMRYSFDVTASNVGFGSVSSLTNSPVSQSQIDALIADQHLLGAYAGQTGSLVFDLELMPSTGRSAFDTFSFTCVSGLLCNNGAFVTPMNEVDQVPQPGMMHLTNYYKASGYYWDFKLDTTDPNQISGTISFTDDVLPFGVTNMGSDWINWSSPSAQFTLSNGSRSQVLPTPLPAAALLMAGFLVPFAWARRRKNRA